MVAGGAAASGPGWSQGETVRWARAQVVFVTAKGDRPPPWVASSHTSRRHRVRTNRRLPPAGPPCWPLPWPYRKALAWHPHAVYWFNGHALQVDRAAQRGEVEDINAAGVGTGVLHGAENRASMALFRRGSRPTYLSGLPGTHYNNSYSITSAGQVSGSNQALGGAEHAVVWSGNGPVLTLRPLSGQWSRDDAAATYLSDAVTAAGYSGNLTTGNKRATVWTCAFAQAFQP